MVLEPTLAEKVINLAADNWVLAFPVAIFLASFLVWYLKGRDPVGRGVIIPEYEVPEKLSPLEVSVIINQGFNSRDLSAEIIYLAVSGHLTIEQLKTERRFSLIKLTTNLAV